MKTLIDTISEALKDTTVLNNLEVKWNGPDELFIQVPESYGESDIQIYMDDTLLAKMPIDDAAKALGKNFKELNDEYFAYESMEATQGTSQKADILWDDHYDQSMNGTNMNVMRIKGIKYCVSFNKFTIEEEMGDEEKIRDFLYELFNGMSVDTEKDLPFEITLNKDNIIWK